MKPSAKIIGLLPRKMFFGSGQMLPDTMFSGQRLSGKKLFHSQSVASSNFIKLEKQIVLLERLLKQSQINQGCTADTLELLFEQVGKSAPQSLITNIFSVKQDNITTKIFSAVTPEKLSSYSRIIIPIGITDIRISQQEQEEISSPCSGHILFSAFSLKDKKMEVSFIDNNGNMCDEKYQLDTTKSHMENAAVEFCNNLEFGVGDIYFNKEPTHNMTRVCGFATAHTIKGYLEEPEDVSMVDFIRKFSATNKQTGVEKVLTSFTKETIQEVISNLKKIIGKKPITIEGQPRS